MADPKLSAVNRRWKVLIEREGVTIESWNIPKSAHVKFQCRLPNGSKRMLVAPGSSSDYRAEKNMVALVRRWIRDPEIPTSHARKP